MRIFATHYAVLSQVLLQDMGPSLEGSHPLSTVDALSEFELVGAQIALKYSNMRVKLEQVAPNPPKKLSHPRGANWR